MPIENIEILFAGQRVVAADPLRYPEAAGRANGYLCPLGPEPGIGYVLLTRKQWNEISYRTYQPQPLVLKSLDRTITIPSLYVINAIKVSNRASAGDPNAVYMLKLADRRWHARMSDIELQINVRCPAPPATSGADLYYEDSLDEGNPYTWSTACETIWAEIPGFGDYPGLPYFPNGDPEGFRFFGVSAVDALMAVLKKIGCTVHYDPLADEFDIVRLGIDQPGLQQQITKYRNYLRDSEPFGVRPAMVPETIRTYFHAIGKHYGTEMLTQQASGNWMTENPVHHVDTPTSEPGAISGTVVSLWDDLPAVYKFDGTLDNESALNSRAEQRAAVHLAELRAEVTRFRRTYSGVVDILPGSQVKAVHWRNADSRSQVGEGLVTEVMEFPGELVLPDAAMRLGEQRGGGCEVAGEAIAPPDFARKSYLNFPPLIQLVAVDGSGGNLTASGAQNVWSGQVLRTDPEASFASPEAPYESLEACWIALTNPLTGGDQEGMKLAAGDRFLARLSGSKHVVSSAVITLGDTVPASGNTTAELPNGATVTVFNETESGIDAGAARATFNAESGQYELAPAEEGDESGTVLSEDTRPLYVIVRGENCISPVTLSSEVEDDAEASVELQDGRTVTAKNKSGQKLEAGNATAYLSMATSQWYLTGSAEPGEGSGESTDVQIVTIYTPGTAGTGCMWPGKIASPTGGPAHCTDQFPDGSDCWIVVLNDDVGSASPIKAKLQVGDHFIGFRVGAVTGSPDVPIYAIRVTDGRPAETIEGYVTFPFTKDDPDFEIEIETVYRGWWPNVAHVPDVDATWMRVINPDNRYRGNLEEPEHPYLFEGDHLAFCRANLDWEASLTQSLIHGNAVCVYRAAVVQCPEEPIEHGASPGAPAYPMQTLYDAGAQSDQAMQVYYYS